ncbi:hypothetical protein N0V91_004694 [Didymella pomorum]|jgi:hypothetical protein|uniref:Uncharacterized protein n=1 Tax=Didymella pomorum TaxID=749634 RepID=A0A9W9D7D2_9PLEO|nr:hypothetical protein N0V91_004694 [Didymella pomorum]
MRFPLSTLLALLPLAYTAPSSDITSASTLKALIKRVAEPAPVTPVAPLTTPGCVVQHFEAWIPMDSYKDTMLSRAYFNVTQMPPVPGWVSTCWKTTKKPLCDPNVWYPCTTYMHDQTVTNEQVMFRFGHGLSSVGIKRTWTYAGTTMTATATEAAEWNESVNPLVSNVTVSQYGKCYEKPNGWMFAWKSMTGLGPQQGV